jgi:large conductance mechanosensitive channel
MAEAVGETSNTGIDPANVFGSLEFERRTALGRRVRYGMDRSEFQVRIGRGSAGMFKGFRDFIMRGNVVDLAVGIVVGAAFTGLVTQFTTDFVNPLIKIFGGSGKASGSWKVGHQAFLWADFLNAVVNFLIVAAVLYFFVVMPLNKLAERRNRNRAPDPVQISDEVALLIQIRDELVAANRPAPTQRIGDDRPADIAETPNL